jgi:SAM-dependent methyltransferase
MDIGCSSGAILKLLLREFRDSSIFGADYVRGPLDVVAGRLSGVPLLQFDLTACPLPDGSLDGIVLLNVLEHIEEDEAALAQIARILKPGGIVVIEVPAGPNLYDIYEPEAVAPSALPNEGVDRQGFSSRPPYPDAIASRVLPVLTAEEIQRVIVSSQITAARSNPLLYGIIDLEAKLRSRIYYPFGIRCLLTCRRPVLNRHA